VVIGGDLNLREAEARAEPCLRPAGPPGAHAAATVRDCWEAAGSDAATRFTWDLERNTVRAAGGG
jgi:hypothetical protein